MMLRRLNTYFQVWLIHAKSHWQVTFINRATSSLFFMAKTLRFSMLLVFLLLIKQQVAHFAGYTTDQLVVFFLTYHFVDLLAQILYRGVYMFKPKIVQGTFDSLLAKPLDPLFQALTSEPDIIDTVFLVPSLLISGYIFSQLSLTITWWSALWFGILFVNSLLIATAIHIVVLVVGVLTTEVDGVIWVYRDLMQLGRFPVTIYHWPLKLALFFLVPVGMMITIPAEVLFQATPTYHILIAFLMGIGSCMVSLVLWKWSLTKYSSASS